MLTLITKRDGRQVPFNEEKIEKAIEKAFIASEDKNSKENAEKLTALVLSKIETGLAVSTPPTVEEVQDLVESVLIEQGFAKVAKKYILYRAERSRAREMNSRLMKTYEDIVFKDASEVDVKRENANIDGDSAMGSMLKFGSEGAKHFYELYMLKPEHAKAHADGDIHIHDLDFYSLTTTCCQIDLDKLFKNGFSTGHGVLREPKSIQSYTALAAIAIQANQNDQHGGQSIPSFDYAMAPGVRKSYRKIYRNNLARFLDVEFGTEDVENKVDNVLSAIKEETGLYPMMQEDEKFNSAVMEKLKGVATDDELKEVIAFTRKYSEKEIIRATYQAMEAIIHNLNTMNSRAGAQVPFSSINYGTDTSPEGRLVMQQLLLATEAGLGRGETPIFPIQIFKVKEGVNYNPGDPNYDLFRLAIRCSAKRLFPNFSFLDAPYNLHYYKPGHPETEVTYMGCRTRVIGNVHDPDREIAYSRGNLSFTSINLPRLAIMADGDIDKFFSMLDEKMELVADQMLERFEVVARKKVYNFPFLMGQGVWLDSEKLKYDDEIREVIKHGTLSMGFIGLAETLKALIGKHHGESEEAQKLGLKIVSHMRDFVDRKSQEEKLNFTLLATPAEGLSGRFVKIDKKVFGEIPGITDRDYYTNSFHIPVYFPINAYDKIRTEAPYHAYTNAGHITYIEMDGDPSKNLEAFERVIRCMHDEGVGYGSINHPVDRDPICGYNGIINDACPCCGRTESEHKFERIRRITGYLVGTLDRFNNGKRAEEHDRIVHDI
ncbi:MAG TPA: anaerobic ribonucleoside triphosphate reductase [Christensenellaceae bacterium]|nr:anaerobic ribonucleoside triphosphate reductase [Christensenellaceae bacterium]